jgi:hypothetical protein
MLADAVVTGIIKKVKKKIENLRVDRIGMINFLLGAMPRMSKCISGAILAMM